MAKMPTRAMVTFYVAVNSLSGFLREQRPLKSMASKKSGLWAMTGGFRTILFVSFLQKSLIVVVIKKSKGYQ